MDEGARKVIRLGRVAETISGVGFPLDEQGLGQGDLPFLKVSDLADPRNSRGLVTAANWITKAQSVRLGVRVVPPDSIIFPNVGAALLGNARAISSRPCAIDNNLMAIVPMTGHPRYWLHVMRGVDMADLNLSGTIPFISEAAVRDLMLPIDMSNEQQVRIANYLDEQVARIDNVIATRRAQHHAVRAEFDSLLHDAVTGASATSRKKSGFAWAGSLPTYWGSPRICQVARMGTGHTPSRSEPDYWIHGECVIPWLTTGDVHRFRKDEINTIDDTVIRISQVGVDNSAAVVHPAGTVALSRTASAGFSIEMATAMATSQDYATWTPGPLLLSRYLLWCLRSMRQDIMGRLAVGSTHKTIYFPDLMSIRIPLPSIEEQQLAVRTITDAAERFREVQLAIDRSTDLLLALKRSLITAAVTGEFDVTTVDGSRVPV